MGLFLLGDANQNKDEINYLTNFLKQRGVTPDNFTYERSLCYLHTEGTLLTSTKREDDQDTWYTLKYGDDINLATVKQSPTLIVHTLWKNELPKLPSSLIDPVSQFYKSYNKAYAADGFFAQSGIGKNWKLGEIIKHGQEKDNRTRKICVDLGWLNNEGEMLPTAPRSGNRC